MDNPKIISNTIVTLCGLFACGHVLAFEMQGEAGLAVMRGSDSPKRDFQRVSAEVKLTDSKPVPLFLLDSTYLLNGQVSYLQPHGQTGEHAEWNFETNEATLRLAGEIVVFKAGMQSLSWGEMIGPSLIDIVSPRDLRDPLQFIKSDQKLASPMALLSLATANGGSFDMIYSPIESAPKITKVLGDYTIETSRTDRRQTIGGRLSHLYRGVSWNIFALEHPSRLPALRHVGSPATLMLNATYEPMQSTGMGASYALEKVVLRGELIATKPIHGKNNPLSAEQALAAAADYSIGDTLLGVQSHYLEKNGGIRPHRTAESWAGAYFIHQLPTADLTFSGLSYQRWQTPDAFYRLQIQYDLNDQMKVSLSMETFSGGKDSVMQLLKHEDQVVCETTLRF